MTRRVALKPYVGTTVLSLVALLGIASVSLGPVAAATDPLPSVTTTSDACGQLARLRLKGVSITMAASLAEGAPVPNSGLSPMFGNAAVVGKAPAAFCRVVGRIRPTPASDIGFEVWLPSKDWDGRLHGVGIGGFAGAIDYYTLAQAVRAGQAAVATDTGHRGTMQESSWSKGQPEAVRDYSWRAIHLSTVAAKQVVRAFYGRGPDKSYFVGCSGGGRQGLVEAARFPDDYDGIVSGAPAASFTELAMALVNAHQAQTLPGAAMRPNQTKFLQEEVLRQCDAGDGQQDGLVADPRQCRFDPGKLLCSNSSSQQCFSDAQVGALRRLHAGPKNSAGLQLAGGYLPSGSESGDPAPMLGWEGYLMSGGSGSSAGRGLADGMLDGLIQKPFATVESFNFDRHPPRLRAASRELDAPPNLSRFFARGGKVIIWHGWADAAIPPEATLRYHAAMVRQSGARAKNAVRLFMVPGVQHCFGGKGADSFGQSGAPAPSETPERNMILAMQHWTEGKRSAPDTFIGRRGHGGGMMGAGAPGPERQRLLCAWPKQAVLQAGADPDRASSYTCA
jgi:pimeloyl-ACP methyl ester carboxylesterase